MPLYEYKCLSCGEVFEKLIRTLSTPVSVDCEKCHSGEVEKMISSFATSGTSKTAGAGAGGNACNSCVQRNCSSCG